MREEQERQYFARGREVLGKNAGGLLANLLKNRNQDIDAASKVIEDAVGALDPREYVAAACQYQHRPKSTGPAMTTVREKELIAKQIGRFYAHAASAQWRAWDNYKKSQGGLGAIRDRDGGWWFPTEWPPNHAGAAA